MIVYGPLRLESANLELFRGTIGVYSLVVRDRFNVLQSIYVGRSDEDLAERLRDHVRSAVLRPGETTFLYRFARDKEDAYHLECELYHEAKGAFGHILVNKIHPDAPGFGMECRVCSRQLAVSLLTREWQRALLGQSQLSAR